MEKRKMGFAAMPLEKRKEISSKGGKAVSSIPGHMSKIGVIGGSKISANHEHMVKIGRNGAQAKKDKNKDK